MVGSVEVSRNVPKAKANNPSDFHFSWTVRKPG
ncbi:hypothetical protein AEGHOMDF_6155 [Methylobacterium soli]|nr:hypothetical protein AEGHOMDF_6155 [Methylobacterium soli]